MHFFPLAVIKHTLSVPRDPYYDFSNKGAFIKKGRFYAMCMRSEFLFNFAEIAMNNVI